MVQRKALEAFVQHFSKTHLPRIGAVRATRSRVGYYQSAQVLIFCFTERKIRSYDFGDLLETHKFQYFEMSLCWHRGTCSPFPRRCRNNCKSQQRTVMTRTPIGGALSCLQVHINSVVPCWGRQVVFSCFVFYQTSGVPDFAILVWSNHTGQRITLYYSEPHNATTTH